MTFHLYLGHLGLWFVIWMIYFMYILAKNRKGSIEFFSVIVWSAFCAIFSSLAHAYLWLGR